MNKLIIFLFFIFLVLSLESEASIRFGFGSCHDQNRGGNHFKSIAREDIHAWLWLGDNIYADHFSYKERMNAYQKVKSNPHYQKILSQSLVWGTWDDHDYGFNNTDSRYSGKVDSKRAFVQFFDIDPSDPMLYRPGIFHEKIIESDSLRLRFLFLDTRYFQKRNNILGKDQWIWLEEKMADRSFDLTFIASSLNVLGRKSIFTFFLEGWHRFFRDQNRLFELIRSSRQNVVFLSGDRHHSDRSARTYKTHQFIEFMSSGLNRPGRIVSSPYRIGKAINIPNYATIEIERDVLTKKIRLVHDIKSSETGESISRFEYAFSE